MPEVIISDYFYGDEAEMFQYFRIPRQLITEDGSKECLRTQSSYTG